MAILVIVILYGFVGYAGLLPSPMRPLRRILRANALTKQIAQNQHDTPAKLDLAQLCIERHRYSQALELLTNLPVSMQEDPDVLYDTGVCHLHQGRQETGLKLVKQALHKNDGLRRGEPYLELANALSTGQPEQAIDYLREYQTRNYSSCEAEYRIGKLLVRLHRKEEARAAWRNCIKIYHALPAFRRRGERRFAAWARLRLMGW